MRLHDSRDMPVSTGNRKSLDGYETATELLHRYSADPLATIDQVLADDPEFVMGHCLRAGLMVIAGEKSVETSLRQSVEAGERLSSAANERERGHVRAARAWLDGDFARSIDLYGDILIDYPRDSLALQIAHIGDFLLGQSARLRDRIAAVLPAWDERVPGYGYVLGMHAFGLEETQLYDRAEESGRRAVEINPRDTWAIHAVAHVMEMQGRLEDGIDWLGRRRADWAPDNMFAFHNWWHLALFHLDLGQHNRVLQLYDTTIRPQASKVVLEMIDATAMLWRLHLRGVDVGSRWAELADTWAPLAEDGYYAFNDMHAMMAFVADRRHDEGRRLLATLERRAQGEGTNAMMTREVGLPVCQALAAFGARDYAGAVERLRAVRSIASRFGGSHAQRDVLSLTLIEAALRGGQGRLARGLAAERTDLKPASPFNWELTARALDLVGDTAGAASARGRTMMARAA